MRILGIDLAYNHAGWALMDEPKGNKSLLLLVDKNVITIDSKLNLSLSEKLVFMSKEILKLLRRARPDIVVLEDTYTGPNLKTTAQLNNAKGAALVVIYNVMKEDPICVTAQTVRGCLGIKDKKEVFEYFKNLYKIEDNYKKYNDITDAIALAYYYYYTKNNKCKKKK